jgi:hypothetical protein
MKTIVRVLALPSCALAGALATSLSTSAAPWLPTNPRTAVPMTPNSQPRRRWLTYGLEPREAFPAGGAKFFFSNCDDHGPGSLRDAVAAAHDGDFIFASATLACSTITLTTGEISTAAGSLQISGPGPDRLTVGTGGQGRVFNHVGLGLLRIYGMTVSDGYASQPSPGTKEVRGGCIFSSGSVKLGRTELSHMYRVIVENCVAVANEAGASAKGGGVFAAKSLSLYSSRVIDNKATAQPPGLYARGGGVYSGGTFHMEYSEVSGNRAYGGTTVSRIGGVDAMGRGATSIYESAIVNNHADRWGGAIIGSQNYGFLAIIGSTISGNTSDGETAGVYVYNTSPADFRAHIIASTFTANRSADSAAIAGVLVHGPVEIQSSIFSGNTSAGNPGDLKLTTDAAFGSSNLVGVSTGFAPPPDGLVQTNDPGLGPLANNGGPTPTHALLPDSPAIDAGTHTFSFNLYLNYDQRGPGFPRIIGANADIGAYERDPDVILRNGFD